MGLFKWFRKSKPKADEAQEQEMSPSLNTQMEEIYPQKLGSINSVVDNCEQMLEVTKQMEQMKLEYHTVTAYLSDIQKIDRIPTDGREKLEAAARNICVYTKERDKYKTKDTKLTNEQRNVIEKQEDSIANELRNMKKNEDYNGVIKGDMHHLEGEKGALLYEQEEIIKKQTFLKKMAMTMAVLVISLFALIAALSFAFETSMAIPYILTIVMVAIAVTYIFLEENKSRQELKLIERKIHKAINLLNKVKIKYVNNMSLLEYSYEKYDVSSSVELDYIWKQYLIVKENEKKFELNTEKLNQTNDILMEELERYQLSYVEIWTHQAQAILDKREMVEVRHRLNVRRQKLRDNIDYNTKTYIKNKKEILAFMEENKKMQDEIKDILRNYAIEL